MKDAVAMEPVSISYRIKLNDDVTEVFDFHLDGETFDLIAEEVADPPKWAALEFKQCAHCPLSVEEHPYCPLALQLHDIVGRFHETKSIDEVEMEVITDERRVIQKTAIQFAIASMLDLIFPICGCPKTEHMKPMARFHLPLASEEETVFRVTGMYLLAQYFLSTSKKGGSIEFDGLTQIYEDLHTLNTAVASRLQSATRSDSSKNAITLLDMYSTLVPVLLEDELAEMRGFFKAYLPEGEVGASTNYLEKFKAMSLELVPVEGETPSDGDDRPEWLKQLDEDYQPSGSENTDDKPETEKPEVKEPEETEADKILKRSSLTIELEPISETEEPEEAEQTKPEIKPVAETKPNPEVENKPASQDSGLSLSLSLEPIKEEEGSASTDEEEHSEPGKASFKLPDD